MSRVPSIAVLVLAIGALPALGGCGSDENASSSERADPEVVETQPRPETTEPEEVVTPAECPSEAGPGCKAAEGRIVYVEAVDPDGDGDAHFVIADGGSITLPGLTAIDVRRGLRPDPLPGIGDLISAAGPVQTGSQGQSQIHALVLNVARPAG
ncbi:MAG TPA: hypothetical protein VIT85_00725 [Solirubrobacterales bacterium]